MKPKILLFLALVLSGLVFGCASRHKPVEVPILWQNSNFYPKMPDKPFRDYKAIFKYIAALENLPQDSGTLLAIATDSSVERMYPHILDIGTLLVIRADYYGRSHFGIRGMQGQGRYYTFRMVPEGWLLVGIFHADHLRWEVTSEQMRVFAYWHMTSMEVESPTVYTWNGHLFE